MFNHVGISREREMDELQIVQLIESGLSDVEATVKGDGSHFEARVVGQCFEGKSLVQQQKIVYAALSQHITNGDIHALTIKCFTPEQWEKAKKLQVGGA